MAGQRNVSRNIFIVGSLLLGVAFAGVALCAQRFTGSGAAMFAVFASVILAAGFGRLSGTISELFATIVGNAAHRIIARRWIAPRFLSNIEPSPEVAQGIELNYTSFSVDQTVAALLAAGHSIVDHNVDRTAFNEFLETAKYDEYHPSYYHNEPWYRGHKQLQHYLSLALTSVDCCECWVDVASSTSPFPEILTRLYQIKVYRQDLSYPSGVHGLWIGSDAAAIPLPDKSVDAISLHCSYEHFQGPADTRFLYEAARLLRPGASGCIIPLYVSDEYRLLSNPKYWLKRGIPRESGAITTTSRKYWEDHGRFYDASALESRVLQPLRNAGLLFQLYRVTPPYALDYSPFLVLRFSQPRA